MSKATIGGVVGAVIGFYVSGFNPYGAQIGFMIGSGIGASFDTIQGRKVGEMSSPRAQEGEPIPLVFGTARVTGRLMSCGEPSIVEEGGKGGPQVVNETAYLDYSILICESSELRNSLVAGIIMVIQNNKIVYDVTPDSAVSPADNAKWLENKQFYYGEESQGTDPTEQMIHGIGNVPAYRGLCRMVVTHEDVTQHGGGVPTYEFVVSRCPVEPPHVLLVTGSPAVEGGPMWAAAKAVSEFEFTGLSPTSGADLPGAIPDWQNGRWAAISVEGGRYSDDERLTWQSATYSGATPLALVGVGGEWMVRPDNRLTNPPQFSDDFSGGFAELTLPPVELISPPAAGGETTQTHNYAYRHWKTRDRVYIATWSILFRADRPKSGSWENLVNVHDVILPPTHPNWGISMFIDSVDAGGDVHYAVVLYQGDDAGNIQIRKSIDDGYTWGEVLLDLDTYQPHPPAQLVEIQGEVVAFCDGGGVRRLSDGWEWIDTGLTGRTALYNLSLFTQARQIVSTGNMLFLIGADSAPPHDNDGSWGARSVDKGATWLLSEMPITDAIGIACSSDYEPAGGGIIIPDAPGYEIDPITGAVLGPENNVANACGMSLQEIIDELDNRAGIPTANRDSDALAPFIVPGYAIDRFMTVAEAKEVLRPIYRFACPEYDDKIRYELFGRDTDFVVDPDDLIVTGEPSEKSVRGQTVEFPRRLHVQYVDPALGYKPMKQTDERTSPDIRVKGELVMGANVTLEADTAKQAAVVGLKVAWTEREDMGKEIALPIDYYADTIPSHTYTLEGRRFRITDMRLSAGAIYLTSVYDRQSAFFSNAVGTVGPRPTPPGSQVRGPTISMVMNAPVLRDVDDKAGIYWGACGPMTGWKGAKLQVSRDGGATWEDGPTVDSPAVMGELTTTLPAASRYAQDNTNTLAVTMYRDEASMDSTDFEGLMEERNVFAIMYPDGTVEIGQFETAVETADRQWELTGLMRGRQDTVAGEHLAGAKFVLLTDNVRFVAIRPDDVGKTLKFRAVSLGTDPDAAEVQDVTFTTIESLREWQPYNVVMTPDGLGGYCVEWIGRGRLGSSLMPAHSQWFEGYRVTFAFGGDTHVVDTTSQATCVSAATMLAEFGTGYGAPVVTVRARSRVATNDDDFDSPPASPGNPTSGSEPFVAVGTWPGGYVGVPYVLRNGDCDIVVTGGYWDATAYGEIAPGVGAYGAVPLGSTFSIIGIPCTAGTYTASVEAQATSPVAGHNGSAIVSNSVTIAATPTYSTIDTRLRENSRDRLIATTPPWTTFELPSGSLYCFGFDTGDRWGEFTITGSTGPLVVGINVAVGELTPVSSRPGIAVGFPNMAAIETTLGDGTYAMSYDCATGDWEVFKLGTGSIASGNMPLPSGNLARFVCTTNRVSPVVIKGNFGNETWLYAPTGGQTGVPMPTLNIPVAWDDRATPYKIMRSGNSFVGASVAIRLRGPGNTFGLVGKSSGKWRVGIFANGRTGLAVAAYDSTAGGLGAPGTANSIGYDGTTLRWCFGGVASSAPVVVPVSNYPYVIYALDMDNSEVTLCYEDFDANVFPLYTIPSVPAGTWFPAESNSTNNPTLTYNPAGPIGFDDWMTTA